LNPLFPALLLLVSAPGFLGAEPAGDRDPDGAYVTGSLAREVRDAVDLRIAGKDPAQAGPVFVTENGHTARNPACWAADLAWGLAAVSPWNSAEGRRRSGVLISPRHLLFAAHFAVPAGAQVRFMTPEGKVVERTLVAVKVHPDFRPNFPDIAVGALDADVPAEIGFAKVLPDGWREKIPSFAGAPVLSLDQQERAGVRDVASVNGGFIAYAEPSEPDRKAFYHPLIVGDSGKPAFWIVGNELVLLNTWTTGGPGGGTWLVPQKAAINRMMEELGGGYHLTEVDLSGYPSYPVGGSPGAALQP
jgi:hypothetical protein